MAIKRESVEWVTFNGVPYTTELEAILHEVDYAWKAPDEKWSTYSAYRLSSARELLAYAERQEKVWNTQSALSGRPVDEIQRPAKSIATELRAYIDELLEARSDFEAVSFDDMIERLGKILKESA